MGTEIKTDNDPLLIGQIMNVHACVCVCIITCIVVDKANVCTAAAVWGDRERCEAIEISRFAFLVRHLLDSLKPIILLFLRLAGIIKPDVTGAYLDRAGAMLDS